VIQVRQNGLVDRYPLTNCRYARSSAAIRGANDASGIVPEALPVVVSRMLQKGFRLRPVTGGERCLSQAGA
jgi:hypothetical protein